MKIFISISNYLEALPEVCEERISEIVLKGFDILLENKGGSNELIEQFLAYKKYKKVSIYRLTWDYYDEWPEWETIEVDTDDLRATTVERICNDSDYGYFIWNNKDNSILYTVYKMISINKPVKVYAIHAQKNYVIKNNEDLIKMIIDSDGFYNKW